MSLGPSGAGQGMQSVIWLINTLIQLYIWVLIINAVLSWLVAFNVVNTRNRFVYLVVDFSYRLTEPALRPIRRVLPNLGGIDISPIILILLLMFAQRIIAELYFRSLMM
jgi:YggT family protein